MAIRSSEKLTNFFQTNRRHTQKDSDLCSHGRENLKSHTKRTAPHISDSPATGLTINANLYLPRCADFTARAGCVTPRGKVVLPQRPAKKLTGKEVGRARKAKLVIVVTSRPHDPMNSASPVNCAYLCDHSQRLESYTTCGPGAAGERVI
jgi:hypothetical protein